MYRRMQTIFSFLTVASMVLSACGGQSGGTKEAPATQELSPMDTTPIPLATIENLAALVTPGVSKEAEFPSVITGMRPLDPNSDEAQRNGASALWQDFVKNTNDPGADDAQMLLLEGTFPGQAEIGWAGVAMLWRDQNGRAVMTGANRTDGGSGYMGLGNVPIDYQLGPDPFESDVIQVAGQQFFRVNAEGEIVAVKPFGQGWIEMGRDNQLAQGGKALLKSVALQSQIDVPEGTAIPKPPGFEELQAPNPVFLAAQEKIAGEGTELTLMQDGTLQDEKGVVVNGLKFNQDGSVLIDVNGEMVSADGWSYESGRFAVIVNGTTYELKDGKMEQLVTILIQEKYWLDEKGNVKSGYAIPVEGQMYNINGNDQLGMTESGGKILHRERLAEIFKLNLVTEGDDFTSKYVPGYKPATPLEDVQAGFEKFYADAMAGERFNHVGIPEGWDGDGGDPADFNKSFVVIGQYVDNVDFSNVSQVWLTEEQTAQRLRPTVGDENVQSAFSFYGTGDFPELVETVTQPDGSVQLRFTNGMYGERFNQEDFNIVSFWPLLHSAKPSNQANMLATLLEIRFGSNKTVFNINQVRAVNLGDSWDLKLNGQMVAARYTEESHLEFINKRFGALPFQKLGN